jgi:hypothetical protein
MKTIISIFTILYSGFLYSQSFHLDPIESYMSLNSEYNTWLENTGLNEYLELENVHLQGDKLVMYLQLANSPNNDALIKWNSLKSYFEKNRNYSLNEYLLKNMILIYKTEPAATEIKIFDSFYSSSPTLYHHILFNNDSIEYRAIKPLGANNVINVSLQRDILIDYKEEPEFDKEEDTKKAYNTISAFLESYYKNPSFVDTPTDRISSYHKDFDNTLIVEIDKFRDVLKDRGNPTFCRFLSIFRKGEVDCRPFEYLKYEVKVQKRQGRIMLGLNVMGKYYPSTPPIDEHNPDYYNDMKEDFSYYLENYVRVMTKRIKTLLK